MLVAIDNLVGPSAERAQIGLFRAASLSWVLGRPSEAEAVRNDAQQSAESCGMSTSFDAMRLSVAAVRGQMADVARDGVSLMQ
ncbi:hypothetical protein C6A85_45395, partial [Mycobacterium sp. ITM-2017-0098]